MKLALMISAILSVLCGSAFAQTSVPAGGPASAKGFIDPAGPVAAAQLEHFGVITLIMLLVVVPIFVAVPWILLRYRRGGQGKYRPDWDFNWVVEATIWGIPIIIIVLLGSALWSHTQEYDPYRPLGDDPLQIEVVSLDWKFLFLYPEQGVATVDYLALPLNRPVTLTLTSGTVMQSFMVPQLAGQSYTMAGMKTLLNLSADRSGEFVGRNTQYNGDGFATQSFRTVVMPQEEFNTWVQNTRDIEETLAWGGYQTLLEPSIVHEPKFYGAFEPGLFDRVVASFAPHMASGPHGGHSASEHKGAPNGPQHQQHGTAGVKQ